MTNSLLKFIPGVVMTMCLAATAASAQTSSALMASVVGASSTAAISVTATDYNQITDKALLFHNPSFGSSPQASATQQDAITVALGYNFVTFYDQNSTLNLARQPVTGGPWKVITFSGTTIPDQDNHRTPNVGISQNDGRIHLAYGIVLSPLRYRISSPNAATVPDADFNAALFSAERNYLSNPRDQITHMGYPIFVTRETNKSLLLFWREFAIGSARFTYIAGYLDNGSWGAKAKIIDGAIGTYSGVSPASTRRSAYSNDVITHGDDIQITWTWRENAVGVVNHGLMFAQSTDGGLTWKNASGTTVAAIPFVAMNLDSPVKAVDLDPSWSLINQNGSYVDGNGNTHVVLRHGAASGNTLQRYWHYVRTGATWTQTMLPFRGIGGRPKVFIDRETNTVYAVAINAGKVKVYAASKGTDDWGTWAEVFTSPAEHNYVGDVNGRIDPGNRVLRLVAQRAGACPGTTFSRLDLISLELNPNG